MERNFTRYAWKSKDNTVTFYAVSPLTYLYIIHLEHIIYVNSSKTFFKLAKNVKWNVSEVFCNFHVHLCVCNGKFLKRINRIVFHQ